MHREGTWCKARGVLQSVVCFVVFPFSVLVWTTIGFGQQSLPNVLVLLADDLRPDGVAALGNPVLRTPNLDQLVRRGLVFDNAYCFGSNVPAVCLPSRTMLLTGRTYFHYRREELFSLPSLPQSFNQAGYFTYHHGKRGNTPHEIHRHFQESRYVKDDEDRRCGEPGKEIVDRAIEYLQNHPTNRPFLMYLAFANPHDPRVASQEYRNQYQHEEIPLPENYLPVHPFDNGEMTVRDERLAPWPRTEEEIRKHLHDYYAVITGLDYHIGRLLQFLKEQGLDSNTYIVLTSDNGLAVGSHGLMGKQSLYEHSMKVPLVIAGPGISPRRTGALIYLHDLYPTLCDLVGIPVPDGLDGKSAAGIVRGEKQQHREDLLLCYRDVQRAVRYGRWKLIQYPAIHRTQLFDVVSDPAERHDLAGDAAQASRLQELLERLRRLQKEADDPLPLWAAEKRPETFIPPP
jgi:arylsulfatase A-like enzyme